ncbi:MAG: hypothetical protein N0E58_09000 [Candidatus Thiodiazotropha endolucinida]|uniref:Uncharacterized protein n=1 Tax=Candidatus Thiodiazotropha taylori TaxID=2792791 RepID=A0A9E4NK58_9GAMM|nr:hypothetical protein [Candidatus Thiodiazotropha taylori]MCW4236391.1 hypothetical protein [Candidatus Thiodiazotropha endolucinida]
MKKVLLLPEVMVSSIIIIGIICVCFLPERYPTIWSIVAALVGAWWAWYAKLREILSGLKIGEVDEHGVAWITNTSKEWIEFSAWVKDEGLVEEDKKKLDNKWREKAKDVKDNDFKDLELRYKNFKLAPGAKVPIHLKGIEKEKTYVALSAVKIVIEEESFYKPLRPFPEPDKRTRVVVYRYAGDMISGRKEQVSTIFKAIQPHKGAEELHPHNKWVPVESREGKSET